MYNRKQDHLALTDLQKRNTCKRKRPGTIEEKAWHAANATAQMHHQRSHEHILAQAPAVVN